MGGTMAVMVDFVGVLMKEWGRSEYAPWNMPVDSQLASVVDAANKLRPLGPPAMKNLS